MLTEDAALTTPATHTICPAPIEVHIIFGQALGYRALRLEVDPHNTPQPPRERTFVAILDVGILTGQHGSYL